ncbi:MAG: CoA transferase [Lysobacteraceae bacterium]|nr:MAG: CoA transferase [Xanthomonadaceae bacterium]
MPAEPRGAATDSAPAAPLPLAGVRVLDLSRVLAGPWATQLLADLGAEVLKIEHPAGGDDTRRWGPPFLRDREGRPSGESAYYLAANRGKRSLAIDFSTPEGAGLVRALAAHCDVLIENYRPGTLARHGLDPATLAREHPRLVYCSITGYGQSGPHAQRPGYDAVIQAEAGLMSLTGEPDHRPGGGPQKVGVAVADLMTGMYAACGILAALRHAERSGQGQHIDLALFDVQVAALANQAMSYLVGGEVPERMGNAHPSIAPYQSVRAADRPFMLAVGNDAQFRRLCETLAQPALASDPRFATNPSRVAHREALIEALEARLRTRTAAHWLARLAAAGVPCAAVNTLDEVFASEQVRARGLLQHLAHPLHEALPTVPSPIRFSATPIDPRRAPPRLGADTREVLATLLGLDPPTLDELQSRGILGPGNPDPPRPG